MAADQVTALRRRLPPTSTPSRFVFDASDDVTALTHALVDEPVALLVRLRGDRCCYSPPPTVGAATGRPRRNGAKFRCDDPATWQAPTAEHTCEDAQYGTVTVQAWGDLPTVVRSPRGERAYGPRPHVCGTVVRVTVTRHAGRARTPLELWCCLCTRDLDTGGPRTLLWQGTSAPQKHPGEGGPRTRQGKKGVASAITRRRFT